MGRDRLYTTDPAADTLHLYEDAGSRTAALGQIPHCDDDAGTMGGVSHDSLPFHPFLPHRRPANAPALVVSGDLSAEPHLSQPRPHICCLRATALRLPACPNVRTSMVTPHLQRTHAFKLCVIFPDDRHHHTVLFLLPLQGVRPHRVYPPVVVLHLLRHLCLPARYRTTILLFGCRHR